MASRPNARVRTRDGGRDDSRTRRRGMHDTRRDRWTRSWGTRTDRCGAPGGHGASRGGTCAVEMPDTTGIRRGENGQGVVRGNHRFSVRATRGRGRWSRERSHRRNGSGGGSRGGDLGRRRSDRRCRSDGRCRSGQRCRRRGRRRVGSWGRDHRRRRRSHEWRRGENGRRSGRRARPSRQKRSGIDVSLRLRGNANAEMDVGLRELRLAARADRPDGVAFGDGGVRRDRDRAEMRERHGVAVRRLDGHAQTG
jgi:hypothetical protein